MDRARPSPAKDRSAETGVESLRADSLRNLLPGLEHGFTTALGNGTGTSFGEALRRHLTGSAGRVARVHLLDQHHSADIVHISPLAAISAGAATAWRSSEPGCDLAGEGSPPQGDGAVVESGEAGWIVVRTADCVPILAVHPGRGAAAALHAGWRGAAQGILPNLLDQWRRAGGIGSVRLAFGPSIRSCCYEVKSDCLAAFHPSDLAGAVRLDGRRTFLELPRVLLNQALGFGIAEDRVEILPQCTCCHVGADGRAVFASYRRSLRTGEPTIGRNATYIGLTGQGS